MTKPPESWIGAADAVHLLGISRATLYAYVSRGFVRSEPTVGKTRARRYAREDVERLKRRAEERRSPGKVAEHAMQWGLPILESSITLIDGGHLYYRGHDAVQLSRTRSIQEVASLIWTGGFDASLGAQSARDFAGRRTTARSSHTLDFIPRAQAMLAMNSADDEAAYDLRPDRVA
ncbi:MAG TPA: citrate synthase, partial [Gemmatimonadaceae bacterium]